MQQQMCQPDQNGQQQAPQQMMLCPVNVVYETQILVQPGDQIQPNQTFYINPQNPPPWVQNRPAQNQMIYLQQLPNNIVPSVHQHTDQNQYYIQQNFQNYQQMIQQQIMAQNSQEAYRQSVQMPNVIHVNMVPNMPISNDRTVGQVPNYGANVGPNITQNQINPNNRQVITNVDMQNVQNIGQTKADIQRQIYVNQQAMIRNQQQQIVHNMADPNVGQRYIEQVRPMQTQTVPNPQPVYNTIQNIQMVPKPRNIMTNDNKMINNIPNQGIRSNIQTYTYRPIQPRPQFRPNNPNMLNMGVQTQHPIIQKDRMRAPYIKTDNTRKRKSESPDEIQKKVATPTVVATPIKTVNSSDIGVNTSPVHKVKHIPVQTVATPIKINEEIKNEENKTDTNVKDSIKEMLRRAQVEKMIRNTVFTQARGRVLNDKEIVTVTTENDAKIECTPVTIESNVKIERPIEIVPNAQDAKTGIVKTVDEIKPTEAPITIVKQNQSVHVFEQSPKPTITEVTKVEANTKEAIEEISIGNIEKSTEDNRHNANKSINELRRKETHVSDSTCKEEKDYILTHVLDGYVIQESNIAFPIRKPLKEKTLDVNMKLDEEKQESKVKDNAVKDNSKILVLSSLRLDEEQQEEIVEGNYYLFDVKPLRGEKERKQ